MVVTDGSDTCGGVRAGVGSSMGSDDDEASFLPGTGLDLEDDNPSARQFKLHTKTGWKRCDQPIYLLSVSAKWQARCLCLGLPNVPLVPFGLCRARRSAWPEI